MGGDGSLQSWREKGIPVLSPHGTLFFLVLLRVGRLRLAGARRTWTSASEEGEEAGGNRTRPIAERSSLSRRRPRGEGERCRGQGGERPRLVEKQVGERQLKEWSKCRPPSAVGFCFVFLLANSPPPPRLNCVSWRLEGPSLQFVRATIGCGVEGGSHGWRTGGLP